MPDFSYLREYDRSCFRSDAQAGITVAVFAVPQAMAYAMLAGVAPAYGLYTVMVAAFIGGLWGRSPFISTGPSNSASLLTAAAIAPFAGTGDPMAVVFAFALIVGIVRLGLGLVRAGRLVEWVSGTVMISFTAGIGVLIALGQLHHLFDVPVESHVYLIPKLIEIIQRIPHAYPAAVAVGATMAVIMFARSRVARRVPVALVGIVLCTLLADVLNSVMPISRIRDLAEVSKGLPTFRWYPLDGHVILRLLPFSVAVAIIGLIEVSTISRFFATKHRSTGWRWRSFTWPTCSMRFPSPAWPVCCSLSGFD